MFFSVTVNYIYKMDNKTRQKKYRDNKKKEGWRYFSVMVPEYFYWKLKKDYFQWKIDNLEKEKCNEKS